MRAAQRRIEPGEALCGLVAVALALLWGTVVCVAAAPGVATESTAGAQSDLLGPARAARADAKPDRALELTAIAAQAGADRVAVLLLKADIYGQMQATEKQRRMLQSAIAVDDTLCLPRLLLASMAEQRGLWQQAGKLYKEAIAKDSSCREAYLRLARLLEQHKQAMQALGILERAVESNPDDIGLLMILGDTCRQRELLAEAETVYGRIIVQGDSQSQSLAYRHLGDIYTEVGQFRDAFDCYVAADELVESAEPIAAQGYARIFAAADSAVAGELDGAWKLLLAFVEGGPLTREDTYLALEESAAEITRIGEFGEQLESPPSVQKRHAQRQLFYAIAHETVVDAQLYLDTGYTSWLEAARERHAQTDQECGQLSELIAAGPE